MPLPIDIVLVRHGQSEGNKAKRLAESGDAEVYSDRFRQRHTASYRLTDLGRQQAIRTGKPLRESGMFDRYCVSEYIRAKETALLLDLPDAQWYPDFLLCERNWGELDHYSPEERERRFGEVLARREHEPFFWSPPSGESFSGLCQRLRDVLGTWHRECSDKRIIVVCHGEVMWGFRVLLERMSQERFRELHLSEASEHRIHNCQIIHYTRRDPKSGRISKYANWMRMERPAESDSASVFDTRWKPITRKRYSNDDLRAEVERVTRMVA